MGVGVSISTPRLYFDAASFTYDNQVLHLLRALRWNLYEASLDATNPFADDPIRLLLLRVCTRPFARYQPVRADCVEDAGRIYQGLHLLDRADARWVPL